MAIFLSRTPTATLLRISAIPPPPIFHSTTVLAHRRRSTKAKFIEIDLDSSSTADAGGRGAGDEVSALKRLEDIVHDIIVRRSAPDWLPFVPGTSYWVPPRPRAHQIVEIVGKISKPLSKEEKLSLTGVHGCPCSSFFLDGVMPHNPAAVEMEFKVHVPPSPEEESKENTAQSED